MEKEGGGGRKREEEEGGEAGEGRQGRGVIFADRIIKYV